MKMKKIAQGILVSNQPKGHDVYQAIITLPSFSQDILPGQFVQISTYGKNPTFLKRPISVYGYVSNQLSLLYKDLGKGTHNLSEMHPGLRIDLILPLGNTFTPPKPSSKVLLIAGGIGIAPLVYYINYYHSVDPSVKFTLVYGVDQESQKIELDLPKPFPGDLYFHADYQNELYQGNLLDFYQKKQTYHYDHIISCGPTPMMKAFATYFQINHTRMEVSLESNMACGYGVCLGCAFPSTEGSKTVCVDGPVFPADMIDWTKVWTH